MNARIVLTNAELSILGLVLERPRHGYAIEQVIEERGMRDWTEVGFSSIYYILNKLEKQHLIDSQLAKSAGKGPARKVYRITPQGQGAWFQATIEALGNPGQPHTSFLLGLVGLPAIPKQDALAALRRYREALVDRKLGLRDKWEVAAKGGIPLFLEGMFSYSSDLVQAEIDWLDEFVRKLEKSTETVEKTERSKS
jgi:DNA-binding PadR family transcriptional regulator